MPPESVRVGVHDRAQPWVEVFARVPVLEAIHEALMVEPGGDEADVVLGNPDEAGQRVVRIADAVAHTDRARGGERRSRPDAPGHHGHWVGVVEQQAVRIELGHLLAHGHHHRDRAEPSHDPADTDRVGDRLAHPVLLGDLEVGERGSVPAHLDLVDDVVGTLEGRASLGEGHHLVARAGLLDQPLRGSLGDREALRVDVVQGDPERAVELFVGTQIGQDVAGELDAPGADDRDLRHARKCRRRGPHAQQRASGGEATARCRGYPSNERPDLQVCRYPPPPERWGANRSRSQS